MYNKKKLPKYQDAFDNIIFNPNQNNISQPQPNYNFNQESPWNLVQQNVPNPYTQKTYEVGSPNLPMDNTFGNNSQVNLPPSTEMYSWADDPQNLRNPFDNTIPEDNMLNETKEKQPFFPNMYQSPYSANEYAFNAGALGATARGIKQGNIDAGKGYGKLAGVGAGLSVLGGIASGVKSALQGAGVQKSFTQAEQERQENLRRHQTQNFTGEKRAFNEEYMRTNNNVRGLDGGMFKNNPFSMQEGGAIESVIANDITAEPTNPNTNVEVEKGEVVIDTNTNDVRLVQGQTHQQTDEYKGQEYSGVPTELKGGEMVISNNGKVDKKTAKEFGVPKAKTYAELITKHPIQKEIDKLNEKIAEWAEKSEKYLDETEDQAKATTNSRNLEFISGKINDLEQELSPLKEEVLGISMSVYEMQEQAKLDGSYEGIKPPIEEQEQMQEGGEMEVIAQEVFTMLQQGADPEQVLAQLIEAGVPQQEAEQLVMMVIEQMQGQQPQMQDGGQQDPTMELLMTFAQMVGMGEQEFEQLVAELQNLPPEQMEQALMDIEQQVLQSQQPQQEMFAQNPYSGGQEQKMEDGGKLPNSLDYKVLEEYVKSKIAQDIKSDPLSNSQKEWVKKFDEPLRSQIEQISTDIEDIPESDRPIEWEEAVEIKNKLLGILNEYSYAIAEEALSSNPSYKKGDYLENYKMRNNYEGSGKIAELEDFLKSGTYGASDIKEFVAEQGITAKELKDWASIYGKDWNLEDSDLNFNSTFDFYGNADENVIGALVGELNPKTIPQENRKVKDTNNINIPSINPSTKGYNFPTTIEDGENVVNEDYSDVETIQSARGKGYYGKQSVPLDQAKSIHSWYFDNKKDFDLTNEEDVKDFQKSYNKEIIRRAKEAGLSDTQVKEQVKKYGFTSAKQGINQIDGMWGAYTSTRPLPVFKKEEVGDEVIVKAEDEVIGQEITKFEPGDWNPQSRKGASGIPLLDYQPDIISGVRTPAMLRTERQELSPVKISPENQIRENQRNNALFGEIVGQNVGVPDNFSRQIADANQQAFSQDNQFNAQQVAQTDRVNVELAIQNDLQNQRNFETYQTGVWKGLENTLAQVNQMRREGRDWRIGQNRDQMAFAAIQASTPDMDYNYNPFTGNYDVEKVGQRTLNAPENIIHAEAMYGDKTKTQDGGKPIKKKFKFKPKKK